MLTICPGLYSTAGRPGLHWTVGIRTHDVLIPSPAPYRYATEPPSKNVAGAKIYTSVWGHFHCFVLRRQSVNTENFVKIRQ